MNLPSTADASEKDVEAGMSRSRRRKRSTGRTMSAATATTQNSMDTRSAGTSYDAESREGSIKWAPDFFQVDIDG